MDQHFNDSCLEEIHITTHTKKPRQPQFGELLYIIMPTQKYDISHVCSCVPRGHVPHEMWASLKFDLKKYFEYLLNSSTNLHYLVNFLI